MRKQLKILSCQTIAFLLAVCLLGCNMASPAQAGKIDASSLKTTVSKVIDEEIDTVKDRKVLDKDPVLEEAVLSAEKEAASTKGSATVGTVTVKNTLGEDSGRDYLEFCYAANFEDRELCLEKAKSLMDEQKYEEMIEQVNRQECRIQYEGWQEMKTLSSENQAAFYKELRSMVIKTTVLLVAGIVYAVIPTTIFWGKVSAACAIAIAAGILAATIIQIVQYYKSDDPDLSESFESWLESVAAEPSAYYAIAASMINVGITAKQSPVVTGLIICVFALYQVIDPIKDMLAKYGEGGSLQE